MQIGDTWAEAYAELMPGVDDLSDSKFGLVVQDFAGSAHEAHWLRITGLSTSNTAKQSNSRCRRANALDSGTDCRRRAGDGVAAPMEFALTGAHESMAAGGRN